jgi:hypothetical protein
MKQLLQSPSLLSRSPQSSRPSPQAPVTGLGRVALVPLAFSVSGCEVIQGIFKAGVWVGVIAVAIVLAVAFGLVRMMSK